MVSPAEQIDDLAYVEQEIAELQGLIKQQFGATEELNTIQSQLSAISQFQEMLQTSSRKVDTTLEQVEKAQGYLSSRADALEARMQKMSGECAQLKQTLEQTLLRCAEEWAQQQQSMEDYMNEFETRLQKDMQHTLNRLGEAGAASSLFRERLEKLDVRVRGLNNSVKKMGNTLKVWNGIVVASSIVGVLLLVMLGLVVL